MNSMETQPKIEWRDILDYKIYVPFLTLLGIGILLAKFYPNLVIVYFIILFILPHIGMWFK